MFLSFLQVTELECQSTQTPVIKSQKTELNQTIEELENTLRDKEEVCVCVRVCVCGFMYALLNLLYPSGNGKVERRVRNHE